MAKDVKLCRAATRYSLTCREGVGSGQRSTGNRNASWMTCVLVWSRPMQRERVTAWRCGRMGLTTAQLPLPSDANAPHPHRSKLDEHSCECRPPHWHGGAHLSDTLLRSTQ